MKLKYTRNEKEKEKNLIFLFFSVSSIIRNIIFCIKLISLAVSHTLPIYYLSNLLSLNISPLAGIENWIQLFRRCSYAPDYFFNKATQLFIKQNSLKTKMSKF